MGRRWRLALVVAAALGCGNSLGGADAGCPGSAETVCIDVCGTDLVAAQICTNGVWSCPPGFFDGRTCDGGSGN